MPIRARTLTAVLLLLAPGLVHADPTFVAPTTGDWFDGSSWGTGVAPTAADDPVIDNGGTATAASDSPFYPGDGVPVAADDLSIGARYYGDTVTRSPVIGAVDATGALEVTGLDVDVSGVVRVGANETPDGSAYAGSLSVTGGSLTGTTGVYVGRSSDATDVDGRLMVTGDLAGYVAVDPFAAASLVVGDGRGSSTQAHLDVGGHVQNFRVAVIGSGWGLSGRNGTVDAHVSIGGDMTAAPEGYLRIGEAGGSSPDGSIPGFDVTASLTVGGDLTGFYDSPSFGGPAIGLGRAGSNGRADAMLVVGGNVSAPAGERLTLEAGSAQRLGNSAAVVRIAGDAIRTRIEAGVVDQLFVTGATDAVAIGDVEVGSILGGGVRLGYAYGAGLADGRLHVRGDIASDGTLSGGPLGVGDTSGDPLARAFGQLVVDGSIYGPAARVIAVGTSLDGYGTATGSIAAEGIQGADRLRVGYAFGSVSVPDGLATGSVLVRSGGISSNAFGTRFLQVGWATGGASAVGHVDATGDVGYFSTIDVGVIGDTSTRPVTGNADGTLIVRDGTLTAGTLRVGLTEGTGSATGHLHLDHALAQLDGGLELGDGATLELGIDGPTRGTRYGAIDTPLALLDGILRLSFTTTPAAGTVFDLIVSESAHGITGAFDLVEILGIDPALIQLGVELIPTPIGPVEAFRARVVPEPGVGLLLGLGLGLLGIGRRRTRTPTRSAAR